MRALADGGSVGPAPPPRLVRGGPPVPRACPSSPWTTSRAWCRSDNIPYTMEGWVIEATPEQQERMWWSGIEALAAVHRTDWRAAGLDWLGDPEPGPAGASSSRCPTTATSSTGPPRATKVPVIESTWQWLVEHRPAEEGEVVLSWGDSRIGNIIWDDFRCAAVLDWEMASLGQPEMDLGWWLYFDRQFSEGLGVPRPAGLRLARGHRRALLRAHGPAHEGHLLLRGLLGLPLRRDHVPALGPGLRGQPGGRGPTWRPTTSPPSSWPRCSTWSRPA